MPAEMACGRESQSVQFRYDPAEHVVGACLTVLEAWWLPTYGKTYSIESREKQFSNPLSAANLLVRGDFGAGSDIEVIQR